MKDIEGFFLMDGFFCEIAGAAPYYVREAEKFMRANLASQITLGDLSCVTGVSARTLNYGFQRFRDISPMAYLRAIRLDLAHSLLCSKKENTTVSNVALICGIPHQGRFAGWYFERFQELPSETVGRVRNTASFNLTASKLSYDAQSSYSLR